MEIIYSEVALTDIDFWKRSGNKVIQRKIQHLIDAIEEDPFRALANLNL